MPKGLQGFQKKNQLGRLNRGKIPYNKGKPRSKEAIEKLVNTCREKRKKRRSEMKKKFYKEHPEIVEKIRQSLKGHIPWNKGKKLGKGFYPSHDCSHLKKFQYQKGEKHPLWKGGTSRNKHYLGKKEYRDWRMKVFLRDSFTCVNCGNVGGYLEAHHIKSWADYPELRFVVDNGVTLCQDCHDLI